MTLVAVARTGRSKSIVMLVVVPKGYCNIESVGVEFYCQFTGIKYSGSSLLRSPTGLGKSDLNGEVTFFTGVYLHCGIQFGTEPR